jgi:tRNA(Ile)-lysidine synthase
VAERMDLQERIPEKDYTKLFDYDMIKGSLVLRSPKEGDFFTIDEEGHRKKLNRHYIDRKIPRSRRQEQLVLAEGAHVLWAFPDRMSEAYKIKQDTKKILIVTKERKRS